jgi:WD40 repeat protein
LGSHTGAVTALEPAGEGRLLSAGRDGRLVLWDLPGRRALAEQTLPSWPRAVQITPDRQKAVLFSSRIEMVSLPDLQVNPFNVRSAPLSRIQKSMPRCAAFDPTGILLVGQFNGQVVRYAANQTGSTYKKDLLLNHSQPITAIQFIPGHPFVITASHAGDLKITRWPDCLPFGALNLPEKQLTSLKISPDGSFMATGVGEENIILWDLRTLDLPVLVTQPIASLNARQTSMLNVFQEEPTLPLPARNAVRFLALLLQRRFRFEIEIGDLPQIQAGEFDIIIE